MMPLTGERVLVSIKILLRPTLKICDFNSTYLALISSLNNLEILVLNLFYIYLGMNLIASFVLSRVIIACK